MQTRRSLAITVALVLVGADTSPALAQDFNWSRLYDSSTPLPGTNQAPFFLSPPAIITEGAKR